eukprot:TRINITY_DN31329_c0_g1_i1.p1 TRINITY_DN31329_c0_g1~~TRINITY_DN31329_c0_g1_i1.p1  ORF type:complete len:910 (-),score=142.42 TRINITY_DN31329_c0_g1_i1:154-2883(-)
MAPIASPPVARGLGGHRDDNALAAPAESHSGLGGSGSEGDSTTLKVAKEFRLDGHAGVSVSLSAGSTSPVSQAVPINSRQPQMRTSWLSGKADSDASAHYGGPGPLASWTEDQVAAWAALTPLPLDVASILREQAITGPVLEVLTDEDLQVMGLAKLGWRRQLLLSRQELLEQLEEGAASTTNSTWLVDSAVAKPQVLEIHSAVGSPRDSQGSNFCSPRTGGDGRSLWPGHGGSDNSGITNSACFGSLGSSTPCEGVTAPQWWPRAVNSWDKSGRPPPMGGAALPRRTNHHDVSSSSATSTAATSTSVAPCGRCSSVTATEVSATSRSACVVPPLALEVSTSDAASSAATSCSATVSQAPAGTAVPSPTAASVASEQPMPVLQRPVLTASAGSSPTRSTRPLQAGGQCSSTPSGEMHRRNATPVRRVGDGVEIACSDGTRVGGVGATADAIGWALSRDGSTLPEAQWTTSRAAASAAAAKALSGTPVPSLRPPIWAPCGAGGNSPGGGASGCTGGGSSTSAPPETGSYVGSVSSYDAASTGRTGVIAPEAPTPVAVARSLRACDQLPVAEVATSPRKGCSETSFAATATTALGRARTVWPHCVGQPKLLSTCRSSSPQVRSRVAASGLVAGNQVHVSPTLVQRAPSATGVSGFATVMPSPVCATSSISNCVAPGGGSVEMPCAGGADSSWRRVIYPLRQDQATSPVLRARSPTRFARAPTPPAGSQWLRAASPAAKRKLPMAIASMQGVPLARAATPQPMVVSQRTIIGTPTHESRAPYEAEAAVAAAREAAAVCDAAAAKAATAAAAANAAAFRLQGQRSPSPPLVTMRRAVVRGASPATWLRSEVSPTFTAPAGGITGVCAGIAVPVGPPKSVLALQCARASGSVTFTAPGSAGGCHVVGVTGSASI